MGFVLAWLIGEGIVTWRWVRNGAPPTPGALLEVSGFFVLLALLHEYPPARTAATIAAYGIDVAAFLQIVGKDPKQATGWPPLPINDPTVLLPAGASGGKVAAEGAGTLSANATAPAGASPGYLSQEWSALKGIAGSAGL
jgi:hypothetical protein